MQITTKKLVEIRFNLDEAKKIIRPLNISYGIRRNTTTENYGMSTEKFKNFIDILIIDLNPEIRKIGNKLQDVIVADGEYHIYYDT